jgi:hypothetical protein
VAEGRAVGRVETVCIVRPIDRCAVICGRCAARGVEQPAHEDEASEEVEISAIPAERRRFAIAHKARKLGG